MRLDPNCTRPYSDEFTIGIEHELLRDLGISATYYYRKNKNLLGRINEAVPRESFTPVEIKTPEGKTLIVYNQDKTTLGKVDRVITNISEFYETFNGFEITIRKRFSNRWQMMAGYTRGIGKGYNLFTQWGFVDYNDPNYTINEKGARIGFDNPNIIKISGSYVFPFNLSINANYRFYTGRPIARMYTVTGLNQGPISVALEPRGTYRYPDVSILDLSTTQTFQVKNVKLELIFAYLMRSMLQLVQVWLLAWVPTMADLQKYFHLGLLELV